MISATVLSAVLALAATLRVNALTRDLHIVNAEISPDGFTREYVYEIPPR